MPLEYEPFQCGCRGLDPSLHGKKDLTGGKGQRRHLAMVMRVKTTLEEKNKRMSPLLAEKRIGKQSPNDTFLLFCLQSRVNKVGLGM